MKKSIWVLLVLILAILASCSEYQACVVSFDTQVEGMIVDPIVVGKGTRFNPWPNNPSRPWYAFSGWYTDPECTALWDFNSNVSGDMTLYAGWNQAFVTFTSPQPFSVKAEGFWEGKLYYSLDGSNWTIYDKTRVNAGQYWGNAYYSICFRGEGNTVIVGDRYFAESPNTGTGMGTWSFKNPLSGDKSTEIKCKGNILTLLDYKKVIAGQSVTIGKSAFAYMFYGQNLVSIPTIPVSSLSSANAGLRCFESMFADCNRLAVTTSQPQLEHVAVSFTAGNISDYCYKMFENAQRGADFVSSGTTYYVTQLYD